MPFINGQEAAGIVKEVGAEVSGVKVGDRVAYTSSLGSYAEYAAVPAARLVKIPDGLSFEQGAAAMLQGMTAHYLLNSTYKLQNGETALIHAAAGRRRSLACADGEEDWCTRDCNRGHRRKSQLARDAGADECIIYTQADFETETKRLTEGQGVHVVYDGVGKATFDKDLEVLRPRGYLVLFGGSSGAVPPFDLIKLSQKGSLFITRPTLAHYTAKREELEWRANDVLGSIASGELKLRIHKAYTLSEAEQAHRDLEGRKTSGKLLLVRRRTHRFHFPFFISFSIAIFRQIDWSKR